MKLMIFGLLLVTVGSIALAIRVYAPGNKAHYDAMGRIPLDADDEATEK